MRIGSSYFFKGGEVRKVTEVKIHPDYLDDFNDYDVATLKVEKKMIFSETVAPVKLPSEKFILLANDLVTVVGWGYTKPNGTQTSKVLKEVDLRVTTSRYCRLKYEYKIVLTGRMFCLRGRMGEDACQVSKLKKKIIILFHLNEFFTNFKGDSGGPVVKNGTLIGLVSFGVDCGTEIPGVYTFIPKVRDFIKNETSV